MATSHIKKLDENGLPVVSIRGVGVTFNLHMSITVFELLGDPDNYLVRQPLSGEDSIVPRKIIDKQYRKWDGNW